MNTTSEAAFWRLEEDVRSALKHVFTFEFWPETELLGNDMKIVTDDTPAFRKTLTLKKVDAVPKKKQGYYCQKLGLVFKREENRFCFYGELEDPVEETAELFALTFETAEVEIAVYNSCNSMTFWENPWDFLRTISFAIGMKAELPGEYCNGKEKELLPLIKEIVALEYWMELPEQKRFSFGELKAFANRYGYKKAEAVLSNLETIAPEDNEFNKNAKKLMAVLCQKPCEPLWREIYNKISDSQAEYPHKVDSLCEKEFLKRVRHDIQEAMHSKGYIGTYPDFVKDGTLKGIHLEQSYNITYFVGMEKRARYHIHCYESLEENEYLTIQFLCGTALLKKEEDATDKPRCDNEVFM